MPDPARSVDDPRSKARNPDEARLLVMLDELRDLAFRYLARERRNHTLAPTDVVDEAFLRLVQSETAAMSAEHLHATAARVIRNLLVDHARRRHALKRKGQRVTLADRADEADGSDPDELLALDEALVALEADDPEASRMIELRFFAHMTIDETAEVMGVDRGQINRRWRKAKLALQRLMDARSG